MENRENANEAAQNPAHFPGDLASVIAAWPRLPEDARQAILGIIGDVE